MGTMNRILNIPAEHLHPGDRIVGPHLGIYAPGTTLEVREPGVYRTAHTPQACVEVAVFGPDPGYPWTARRLHTLTIAAAWAFDIDRPNLVIPGLERDPFDGVGIMDDHAHGDNCDYCASKEHARPAPRPASPTINRDHWGR